MGLRGEAGGQFPSGGLNRGDKNLCSRQVFLGGTQIFARAGQASESQSYAFPGPSQVGFQSPGTGGSEGDYGLASQIAWCLDWLVSWEGTQL